MEMNQSECVWVGVLCVCEGAQFHYAFYGRSEIITYSLYRALPNNLWPRTFHYIMIFPFSIDFICATRKKKDQT